MMNFLRIFLLVESKSVARQILMGRLTLAHQIPFLELLLLVFRNQL